MWQPYLTHYTTTQSSARSPLRPLSEASPQSSLPAVNPARLAQAVQLPSHEGIFNSTFANSDEQSADYGWDRSGAVTIANGQAVLSEDSTVISTLSQLFTLPSGASHLRFTLAPLTSTVNGQSSFVVDVDLTGLAVGTGARLSFDLLGFGDRTSTVTIDNVLLTDGTPTAAPVAVDDYYTVSEGGSTDVTTFGLLSNDLDIDTTQAGLSALLVSSPIHGTLTLNADGSFSYVHNGSETLTDSFTYRVSDGINFSNIATVSLTTWCIDQVHSLSFHTDGSMKFDCRKPCSELDMSNKISSSRWIVDHLSRGLLDMSNNLQP